MTSSSEMIEFIRQNLSRPITLTGLMGAGKSTIGDLLAGILDIDFIDSDQTITKMEGMSIEEIFDKKGESYFRELERSTFGS